MQKTQTLALTLIAAALLAAGCASKVPLEEKKDVPVETRSGTAAGAGAGGAAAGTSISCASPRSTWVA